MLTPSETRALLEELGHRPRQQLGQNFLVEKNVVQKQCRMAELAEGDTVVEVGPGLGTLTLALLKGGAQVFAVELDKKLATYIRETLCPEYPEKLNLLEGDAVSYPLGALPEGFSGAFKIIANLPYAITSPWMDGVLQGPLPQRMVLMIQKEAADRLGAHPGSKAFGAISIFLQSAYSIEGIHRVARQCFYPAPGVDSVLIALKRRSTPFIFNENTRKLIGQLFQQRRKQIASLAKHNEALMSWIETNAIAPETRPEAIAIEAWQALAKSMS